MTENLLALEQNAVQINMTTNNLSVVLDELVTDLSNLNETIAMLTVSNRLCRGCIYYLHILNVYNAPLLCFVYAIIEIEIFKYTLLITALKQSMLFVL